MQCAQRFPVGLVRAALGFPKHAVVLFSREQAPSPTSVDVVPAVVRVTVCAGGGVILPGEKNCVSCMRGIPANTPR